MASQDAHRNDPDLARGLRIVGRVANERRQLAVYVYFSNPTMRGN
jgi:hypothetical protein